MTNKVAKILAKNMKRIHEEKEMSQGDICRALDLDRGFISSIENAKRNPILEMIEKIVKALDITIDKLLK